MKGRKPTPCTIPAISTALRTNISEPQITRIRNTRKKQRWEKASTSIILVLLFRFCVICVNPCDPGLLCLASVLAFVVIYEAFKLRFGAEVHQEAYFHVSSAKIVHDLS